MSKNKRLTIRVPLDLYNQIVAYKVQAGLGSMTEAMGVLWREGLLGVRDNSIIERLDGIERALEGLGNLGEGRTW